MTWFDSLFGCCMPWLLPSRAVLQSIDGRPVTPYPHPSSHYTPGDAYINTQANSLAKLPPRRTYGNMTEDTLPPPRDHSNSSSSTRPNNQPNNGKPLPRLPRTTVRIPSTRTRRPSRDLDDLVSDELPKDYPLVPSIMVEVVDKLDHIFDHIHYAICGLSAMTLWGYTQSVPLHISILVPDYSKDVIKSWAKTKDLETHPDKPDYLWLRTRDGIPRKIRIKWLSEESFDRVSIVSVPLSLTPDGEIGMTTTAGPSTFGGLANTKVVSLASMLDQIAEAYVKDKRAQSNPKYMATIANHVFWLLHKIIDDGLLKQGAVSLTPENVPAVLDPKFWDAFTKRYPESPGLFSRAGLESFNPRQSVLEEPRGRYDGNGANRSTVNQGGMYMHDHAGRSLTSVYTGVAPNARGSVATSVATYGSRVDRKPTEASNFQADRNSHASASGMTVVSVDGVMITSGMFGNLFRDDD